MATKLHNGLDSLFCSFFSCTFAIQFNLISIPHSVFLIKAIWSVHICPTLVINASAAARITNIGLVSHFSHVPQHQMLYHEFIGGGECAVEHGISASQMLVCELLNDDFS